MRTISLPAAFKTGPLVIFRDVMTTWHMEGERKAIALRGSQLQRVRNGKVTEGWGFTGGQDTVDEFFPT